MILAIQRAEARGSEVQSLLGLGQLGQLSEILSLSRNLKKKKDREYTCLTRAKTWNQIPVLQNLKKKNVERAG